MRPTRRSLLKTGLGAGTGAGLIGALPGLGSLAAAADPSGYKAVVCIRLSGGMDAYDALIPTSAGGHAAFAAPRRAILDEHDALGDDSRTRDALIGLDQDGGATGVGMPRQLAPLAALYRQGNLCVVSNVGPLVERTDRGAVMDGTARLPPRIQSHNDHAALWATLGVEGSGHDGWGGLLMERGQRTASPFAAVAFTNDAAFAAGRFRPAYRMGTGKVWQAPGAPFASGKARDILQEHYAAGAARMDSFLATDFQNAQREAITAAEQLSDVTGSDTAGGAVVLPDNDLSAQLAKVAKLIAARGELGLSRQLFLVEHHGFDTHDAQASRLPTLQAQLADAMAAFYQETVRLGVAGDVLTFTASEFGRTLVPNGDGTDHGWGGHHFVMGGGIAGGRIHGELPEAGLEHDLDMDRGRLIPTTSVEQYAGGIGRWLGLPESELATTLHGHGRIGPALSL